MSPSRIENYRRAPVLSTSRWLLLIFGFLIFVAVSFVLFIRNADTGYRREEAQAIKLALSDAGLQTVGDAVKYVWDESVWVVSGKDKAGTAWMVWERSSGMVKEKASDGLTEDAMRKKFHNGHPGLAIVRLIPGWYLSQPAWELRYIVDPASKRESIDFYAFKDGTLLGTYVLPGK